MDCSGIAKIGPAGRDGGAAWDDFGHTEVAQIFLSYNSFNINWIQFEYVDKNGSLVLSDKHGHEAAKKGILVSVKFTHKPCKEFITRISGYYGDGLRTLEFTTNYGKYGPFGCPSSDIKHFDEKFSIEIGQNCLAGFHGTGGMYGMGYPLEFILNPKNSLIVV